MTDRLLDEPLSVLSGVGPRRLQQLHDRGLFSLGDLLSDFPRDYEDRRQFSAIAQLEAGRAVCIRASVTDAYPETLSRSGRSFSRFRVTDGTGVLTLTFFHQPYLRLRAGEDYIFYGKPELQPNGRLGLVNPSYERADGSAKLAGQILPIYARPGELSQNQLRGWMRDALERVQGSLTEPLPRELLEKYRLCSPEEALRGIHFPRTPEDVRQARRRLIFEELLLFSLSGQLLKQQATARPGALLQYFDPEALFRTLPYGPTGAQRRAVTECFADLCSGRRMNRLLQGDVGSGKTLVAAACAWLACQNHRQAVIMAPTELLARQHQQTLAQLLEPFSIPVRLLCGTTPTAERRSLLEQAERGEPMVLCGTHALIQANVALPHAALMVVDEQHRFGVRQRAALGEKAPEAHLLAMSATPIPRTLTLILYGDLDVSLLDELPPGRTPVFTRAVDARRREGLFSFVQEQVRQGGQVYIVCPAIQEQSADGRPRQSVLAYAEQLRQELPGVGIDILHGQLSSGEKDAVMSDFLEKKTDVLVCTTVVEVGVNVPNATVMVVEDADRFGLSQLHQLRGRVGRGTRPSYCFLMHDGNSPEAEARLSVLSQTTDGFAIAEADLQQRGPGDFFGSRQHGLPAFRLADPVTNQNILEVARQCAQVLLAQDPTLERWPQLRQAVRRTAEASLAASLN